MISLASFLERPNLVNFRTHDHATCDIKIAYRCDVSVDSDNTKMSRRQVHKSGMTNTVPR